MSRRRFVVLVAVVLLTVVSTPIGPLTIAAQEGVDEAAQKAVADRFLQVLEKNPRRGTAFDKVYAHYVERGNLEEFLEGYRLKSAGPEAIQSGMIVGLMELQRGRDVEAIRAFKQVETLDPANAMASYYLGQALILAGQPEEAAQALERAITRQPARMDLLEIYQALGRVYQRARKNDKALDAWSRMEQQFPGDARVREQIAIILLEENEFEAALPRYEELVKSTLDKNRQAAFQVEVADIKIRLGRTAEGLKDFETLLGQLNPGHWLFRDVRRRIETVFLKSDNQAGLVEYYEAWMQKHPEDLDAIAQLSQILAGIRRTAEARSWLQRAIKQAPSNRELRMALIQLLTLDMKYAEAASQYAELEKLDPNNPDLLRDWGRVVLKDVSRSGPDRQKEAATIWRKLLVARPRDAHAASQVADLFRYANLSDEAIELYERAIQLAPDDIQYREYLGEYLLKLERRDDALAVWREIATGSRRTAENLARLAELLARNEQLTEAVEACSQASQLDPRDLTLHFRVTDLLSRCGRHEDALKQLSVAQKLIANDEEREVWLNRELELLKVLDRLTGRIAEVEREAQAADGDQQQVVMRWYWLAMANHAAGKSRSALDSIDRALSLDPKSTAILVAAARLNEAHRNFRRAADLYQKLAASDRRFRTDYLQRVARLEEQLGSHQRAIQVGRELVDSAPANPEVSNFFAQMCFRLGHPEEGILAMRRALRANPGDVSTLIRLGVVLNGQGKTAEGIELLWRAFDRSTSLDERLPIIQQLAEAHGKLNQLNLLYSRLERERQNVARHREVTICLAEAYQVAGEYGTAVRLLESLLTEDSRDIELLIQLRHLSERNKVLLAAIKYQRRIWQLTSQLPERNRLAHLLLQAGQGEEAIELLTSDETVTELTADILKLVDGLAHYGHANEVAARLKKLRQRFPDNWELLYREGVALAKANPDAAIDRFTMLLKQDHSENDPALAGNAIVPRNNISSSKFSLVNRFSQVPYIQSYVAVAATKSPAAATSGQLRLVAQRTPTFLPDDFGSARLGAWIWIHQLLSPSHGFPDHVLKHFRELRQPSNRQQFLDQMVILKCEDRNSELINLQLQFVAHSSEDVEPRIMVLQTLAANSGRIRVVQGPNGQARQEMAPPEPMELGQLDQLVEIYRGLASRSEISPYNITLMDGVVLHLRSTGRADEANQIVAQAIKTVASLAEVQYLMVRGYDDSDLKLTCQLMDRLHEMRNQTGPVPYGAIFTAERLPDILTPKLAQCRSRDGAYDLLSRYIRFAALEASKPTAAPLFHGPDDPKNWSIASFITPKGKAGLQGRVLIGTTSLGRTTVYNAVQQGATPSSGFVFPPNGLSLITHLISLNRQDADALQAKMQAEIADPDRAPLERLYWQHALAHVLITNQDRPAALALLAEGVKAFPERRDLALELASRYDTAGDSAQALALVEDIRGDNVAEQLILDKIILRLAVLSNQTDRARKSAVAVAAAEVASPDIDVLVSYLLQLEMSELAEKSLQRLADAGALSLDQQRNLMELQLKNGKKQVATRTAVELLEKLEEGAPQVVQRSRSGNPAVVQERFDRSALQNACYRVLNSAGELTGLIEDAERQLKESPASEPLIAKLIALNSAADNQARINQLSVMRLKLEADKPANRYALILKYFESNQPDEAIDEINTLLEKDPEFFGASCRDTLFRYNSNPELLVRFAQALARVEWHQKPKTLGVVTSIIEQLHSREATAGAADKMFLQLWEKLPGQRVTLLQRFADSHWWKLKEVQDGIVAVLSPPTGADKEVQWQIFGQVIRHDDGEAGLITVWSRLLAEAQAQNRLDELAAEIDGRLQQNPDWKAGVAMRAAIDLRRGRIEAGQAALERLFPEIENQLTKRSTVAWELGQELIRHKSSLETGAKYLNIAIEHGKGKEHLVKITDWTSASSPSAALIRAYATHGRHVEARRMLVASLPEHLRPQSDRTVLPSIADLSQVLSICRALRSLDYQMDAVEMYLDTLQRAEKLPIGGYDPRTELQASLIVAFGELKAEKVVEFLEQFDPATQVLNPWLFVRQSDPGRGRLLSRWEMILSGVGADETLKNRALVALDRIAQSQPDSLMPRFLAALLSISDQKPLPAKFAAELVQFITKHSLSNPGAPATIGDQDQIALWLIARHCLTRPELEETGRKLGERAIAASQQANIQSFQVAIANEQQAAARQTP